MRNIINEKVGLRNDRDLYSQFLQIVEVRAGMRGRQSWILLFAYKSCRSWAPELASLLPDPDIDGHVISALYKMKASGFSDKVLPFRDSAITWIRKEAARYLEFDKDAEQGADGKPPSAAQSPHNLNPNTRLP